MTAEEVTSGDLRKTIADMVGLGPAEIAEDANLVHLGLGSLEMMRLVTRWRRAGLVVSFRELAAEPTLAAWQRHLDEVRRPEASA
ncbi:phosphopantetheine-binding protein [Streptomyces sp. W16]|uniref:phosphopantetheine-binding protein n=1 Tax=Streptomyces sp. W16 TaxID=3076631 RepID=UPI00295B56FA|nr:phosphopantetheine-binding protein [Streptomyces sp. W16]MDV9169080.1 phosphopantetheine-binding protein [Streptomyces sp. W16]